METCVSEQPSLTDLMEEHQRLEQSLQALAARRTLTPSEQQEVARLKKQKLLTKDRIARLSAGV
ncbi:MAG: YdcH family protein [Myxococcales bacterium]|nr:YdcH family protein [Myxococcales bacterium]